uniref:Uncharacterized protein n=1 Tax=Schistosoma japonicum TaxID=6182 RepID=Q5BXX8_SCHJA|nr:unknown [Schistosoma japonicum]
MRQSFTGFLDSKKGMTHPTASSAIATYIGKSLFMVSIRCTERDFFNSLIDDEVLTNVI